TIDPGRRNLGPPEVLFVRIGGSFAQRSVRGTTKAPAGRRPRRFGAGPRQPGSRSSGGSGLRSRQAGPGRRRAPRSRACRRGKSLPAGSSNPWWCLLAPVPDVDADGNGRGRTAEEDLREPRGPRGLGLGRFGTERAGGRRRKEDAARIARRERPDRHRKGDGEEQRGETEDGDLAAHEEPYSREYRSCSVEPRSCCKIASAPGLLEPLHDPHARGPLGFV